MAELRLLFNGAPMVFWTLTTENSIQVSSIWIVTGSNYGTLTCYH